MAAAIKRTPSAPGTPTTSSNQQLTQQQPQSDKNVSFSIATKLIKFLLQRGLGTDGLFLETLSESENHEFKHILKKLKDESLEHSMELLEHTKHPQVVAQLLLEFLKDLPEPLLTYQNYDSFIMTEYIKEKSHRAKYCAGLLNSAPPHHVALTTQLLTLLHRLVSTTLSNHLTSELLAPLFAPHFLRPKKICQYMKEDEKPILTVMMSLMDDYELLFAGDGSLPPSGSSKIRKVTDSPYVTDLSQNTLVVAAKPADKLVAEPSAKGHKRSHSSAHRPPSQMFQSALTDIRADKDDDFTADDASSNSSNHSTPRFPLDDEDSEESSSRPSSLKFTITGAV